MAPARPAAPLASIDRPIATPMANINGRLSKIAPPAATINGISSISAEPNRSTIPAAGNTAIGNIKALPIRCRNCNIPFTLS